MSDLTSSFSWWWRSRGFSVWLLFPGNKSSRIEQTPFSPDGNDALPSAKHYGYFPLIRRALSAADSKYLLETAPPRVAKQALRERRAVARGFLKGLHEDFSNLARLGRIIATLSPQVSRQQETERLILSLKFQFLYSVVWLRLSTGSLPLDQLEQLTGLVGRLATRMDAAMAEISALSAGQVPKGARRLPALIRSTSFPTRLNSLCTPFPTGAVMNSASHVLIRHLALPLGSASRIMVLSEAPGA